MTEGNVPPPGVVPVADTPPATAATAQSRGGGTPSTDDRPPPPSPSDTLIRFELGDRAKESAETPRYERKPTDPIYRPLKIYTIDPSRRRDEGQTAEINVPFERLRKGPVGARFAVQKVPDGPFGEYEEVDLDEPQLLITNGHEPAPTDPVFHHQMVYAVAVSTYAVFRTALGREISWGFPGERLTLVPHAFEDANAQYVRDRGTLEFGWYKVEAKENVDLPEGVIIYSCLSHDIIAHELTHALLDGLRARFDRATNPDVGAFHEAFADLVALLLRFSYRPVVENIILATHGNLTADDDWLRFVYELASGKGERALRVIDIEGKQKYDENLPDYERGTVLVSAIIDAFVTIFTRKSAPIIHIATGGGETLTEDDPLSGVLLEQLTHIATRLASHLLTMCIRAIDYCPPVDVTFGEYLRALITADRDLVPDDPWFYREALVDAFRKRRIFPDRVRALSEDALLWGPPAKKLRARGLSFGSLRFAGDPGRAASAREVARQATLIGKMICRRETLDLVGLADPDDPQFKPGEIEAPVIESVRPSRRVGPDGQLSFDLVAEVIQRRNVTGGDGYPDFTFRGGATLIFGSQGEVRYVVGKSIKSDRRLQQQRDFAMKAGADVFALSACRHSRRPEKPVQKPPKAEE